MSCPWSGSQWLSSQWSLRSTWKSFDCSTWVPALHRRHPRCPHRQHRRHRPRPRQRRLGLHRLYRVDFLFGRARIGWRRRLLFGCFFCLFGCVFRLSASEDLGRVNVSNFASSSSSRAKRKVPSPL